MSDPCEHEFDPHEHLNEVAVQVLLHQVNEMALNAKKFKVASDFIRHVGAALHDKDLSAEGRIQRIKGSLVWITNALKGEL